MKLNTTVRLILICALCLCLIGCTSTQIITDITTAVNAAEAIIPIILALLGNGPNAPTQAVKDWTQAALTGLAAVSDCLAAGGTQAEQAACVTSNLAKVAATVPELAGLPANVASVVQVLATDVENLLKTYGTTALKTASPNPTVIRYGDDAQRSLAALKGRIANDLGRLAKGA